MDIVKIQSAARNLVRLRDLVFAKQKELNYPLRPTVELRELQLKQDEALRTFKEAYGAALPPDGFQRPHCDGWVLHAPGKCEFCDKHPDWQKARADHGVAFTDEVDPAKAPCPATLLRDPAIINRWPGNRASKP